jgi:damage-control phosphatase, subfamily III
MKSRLPGNIRNVVAAHPGYSRLIRGALEELADTIAGNGAIPSLRLPAWDYDGWSGVYEKRRGQRWHDTDWFFGETYGFRLILEATRYFETLVDPFGPMKQKELESGSPFLPIRRYLDSLQGIPLEETGTPVKAVLLEEALHLSMWGNRADISFTAGGAIDHSQGDSRNLIVDHTAGAVDILSRGGNPVHIVMDNSGAELAGDLVLARAIRDNLGLPVVLHPKLYPTYVSDTTVQDIHNFIAAGGNHPDREVRRFVSDTENEIHNGTIRLAPDDYWCGVTFLADMPRRLHTFLADASMVIIKGDFNYRRVFRDTIWPDGTEPAAALGFSPSYPVLLLRTMKSDCLVGVKGETNRHLDETEPGWRTAGKRGVIQLV